MFYRKGRTAVYIYVYHFRLEHFLLYHFGYFLGRVRRLCLWCQVATGPPFFSAHDRPLIFVSPKNKKSDCLGPTYADRGAYHEPILKAPAHDGPLVVVGPGASAQVSPCIKAALGVWLHGIHTHNQGTATAEERMPSAQWFIWGVVEVFVTLRR